MLYREIIAVCSQIHTKHINTLCGQNVELYVYINIRSVPRSKHSPPQLQKQRVNAVQGNDRSLHWVSKIWHTYSVGTKYNPQTRSHNHEKRLSPSSRPSVRTYQYDSHWNDFREFYIGDFDETPSTNSKFGQNRTKTSDILHEDLSAFYWYRKTYNSP